MSKPESHIDGANVLYWAWSGSKPFGWVGAETDPKVKAIYGLVIAQYDNDFTVYRFGCNKDWGTEQDASYETAEEAMQHLPKQYREVYATWQKY